MVEKTKFVWTCPDGGEELTLWLSKNGVIYGTCLEHGFRIYGPSKKKASPEPKPE